MTKSVPDLEAEIAPLVATHAMRFLTGKYAPLIAPSIDHDDRVVDATFTNIWAPAGGLLVLTTLQLVWGGEINRTIALRLSQISAVSSQSFLSFKLMVGMTGNGTFEFALAGSRDQNGAFCAKLNRLVSNSRR